MIFRHPGCKLRFLKEERERDRNINELQLTISVISQYRLPAEDSQYCNFVLNSGQKFKIEHCGVVQEMFQDMREIFIIGT